MGATSGPGSVVRSVKASPAPSGTGRQRPAKQNQSSPAFVNFHFDFGDLLPRELEKVRRRNKAAAFREAPPLGAEIAHRRSLWPRGREAPAQLHKLEPAEHGGGLGWPDVVARFEIGGGCREYDGGADLAERCQIVAVGYFISKILAHVQTCSCSSQESLCWRLVQDIKETAIHSDQGRGFCSNRL
jgi:hypothetical protein